MAQKLTIEYDKVGDILYVKKCQPYAEQESEELDDYVVARLNPKTGEVEGLEILFWSKRLEAGDSVVLPLDAKLRLAVEA